MYVVIAGAGLVGGSLAARLADAHHDVVVIDSDKAVCEQLASSVGALVLNGRATDISVLEEAGLERADVAVSTMRSDADNLAFSLLAQSFDVPRIIARMRDPRYESAYKQAGVAATSHIVDVFVNQLLLEIDEPHLRQIAVFGAGQASIVVDTVPDGAAVSGKTVSEIAADPAFPSECVITGIYRREGQELVIPRGDAEVREGDRVFLVAARGNLKKASKFLHRKGQ
jgi:trk system potassium uptake protein TrkA